MRRFIVTKNSFTGAIEAVYNDAGRIEWIKFIDCEITPEIAQSYKRYIPVLVEDMTLFILGSGATVQEVPFKITFNTWYDLYNVKRNKQEALLLWNKLPETDHTQAYFNTKDYLKYCHRNSGWYNQMYPDTYLRKKHYLDEWRKI